MTAMGSFSTLDVQSVLTALITRSMAFSLVERSFDSFAGALTNRFRTEFGAGEFVDGFKITDLELPVGKYWGMVWQQRECVHVFEEWLLLPLELTMSTVLLIVWMVAENWRRRHVRPVWKDTLLPLLFYWGKFKGRGEDALQPRTNDDTHRAAEEDEGHLMEVHEMNARSKRIAVTFQWPGAAEVDITAQTRPAGLRKRRAG
jgi:hypothetical protein